jgi:uncharacterized membrane protein YkoI
MKKIIMAVCVAVSLTAFAGLALADKDHESIPKTAVSLEQAIKAVTDKYPGRVVEAELEAEDGKTEYEITVVSNSGESREYTVDAQSGQVSEDKEAAKDEGSHKK